MSKLKYIKKPRLIHIHRTMDGPVVKCKDIEGDLIYMCTQRGKIRHRCDTVIYRAITVSVILL